MTHAANRQRVDIRRAARPLRDTPEKALESNSRAFFDFWGSSAVLAQSSLPTIQMTRGLLLVLLSVTSLLGCAKPPQGRDTVTAVEIAGVPRKQRAEIADGLSTHASSRFLGVTPIILKYAALDEAALEKDIERVERLLRRRGYFEARVTATRIVREAENKVRVELEIEKGERVVISEFRTTGLAELPFDAAKAAMRAGKLKAAADFDEDEFEQAKVDIANALADIGYAFVRVSGNAKIDLSEHKAAIVMHIDAGSPAVYGRIDVEGLEEIPEGPVRNALHLKEGTSYSRGELEEARSALFRLGVFSKVAILPQLNHPESGVVPITVRVEEAALRSVTAGGGATLDVLRLAAQGSVGWTHRNFLGGLRRLSVTTRPGVTFFPTRIDYLQAPTKLLPENSLTVGLEQPSFIEGRTLGFIKSGYNVYPLLYPLPEGVNPSDETVIGYNELTWAVGLERIFFGHRLPVTLSWNWRSNFPFTYQGPMVEGLDTVIVAYPRLEVIYDHRDDPISPTTGFVVSSDLQVASPVMGGLVTDVRLQPEVKTYLPLNYSKNLVLAARVGVGMVFPQDYGTTLTEAGANPDYTDPAIIGDQHKLLFRAFYSGGPNSNRGYPYQRVGPQGTIGFLVPSGVDCSGPTDTLDSTCLRPLGGFSLWEASLEIRWRAPRGPFGFVAFIDASDVSTQVATFTLSEPHISVGPGFRYASPIGPIRLDLGWRIPGLQKLADNPNEPPDISEIPPYDSNHAVPALHLLIGEAF